MKNKIHFMIVLFILWDLIFAQAQVQREPDRERRKVEERWERGNKIFDGTDIPINTNQHHSLSKQEITNLTSIIPDFQVNENEGPNGAYQYSPAIASDGSGNFVITWEDYRNVDSDIYAQRYTSDGSALGSNFKVNADASSKEQMNPAVAVDGSGNFVITWMDLRNSDSFFDYDIYAQRYNSNGSALGSNFKVNADAGSEGQALPAIGVDGSGNFVITWQDYRNGNEDIYAQRYSSDGSALGGNFMINDDAGSGLINLEQMYPAIAVDFTGNFVITWQDERNGYDDIYAQRYTSSGTALGQNFMINDDISIRHNNHPAIAVDGGGNFVITWQNDDDIYAQRYTFNGLILGSNFKVNDDTGWYQNYPAVAVDLTGNFVITWEDNRYGSGADIYAQRYASNGSALGSNFRINDDVGNVWVWQSRPAIAGDGSGNFVITWWDERNGCAGASTDVDIYAQRYNSSGGILGSNFKVNSDAGSAEQLDPAIAVDGSGNFVITWEDHRSSNYDIYAQRYSNNGSALGSNFILHVSTCDTGHSNPAIAMDGGGNFVITYAISDDYSNDDIYARRYTSDGSALGSNFKVNDGIAAWSPAIAMDGSGNFVITWHDYRNDNTYNHADIYAQRYSSNGSTLGSNFKVNDDAGSVRHENPDIAVDSNGNFVITWQDLRNFRFDIYAQRYNSNGGVLGSNFRVNDDSDLGVQTSSAIAVEGNGNFVIAWEDTRNELPNISDIYAQRYNSNGGALGSNFIVNDDTVNAYHLSHDIAMDSSGNFVITWHDRRNGNYDIYAQRYNSNGTARGSNFQVTNNSNRSQLNPDVKLWNGQIYTTWQDNRAPETGFDIWANVLQNDLITTTLSINTPAGSQSLEVTSTAGFSVGDNIVINPGGENEEANTITGFGSLLLQTPLQFNHLAGELIEKLDPTSININSTSFPHGFALYQNYPNPFNPKTTISYQLLKTSDVKLTIFNLLGQKVSTLVNKKQAAGSFKVEWDASSFVSSVYFYRLQIDNGFVQS
ncbi:T9SS type A sorting domain-containing protein, partial [Calditrichota bacterium]